MKTYDEVKDEIRSVRSMLTEVCLETVEAGFRRFMPKSLGETRKRLADIEKNFPTKYLSFDLACAAGSLRAIGEDLAEKSDGKEAWSKGWCQLETLAIGVHQAECRINNLALDTMDGIRIADDCAIDF